MHAGIHTPPVNRMQTGVNTLPSHNFICGQLKKQIHAAFSFQTLRDGRHAVAVSRFGLYKHLGYWDIFVRRPGLCEVDYVLILVIDTWNNFICPTKL